MDSREPTKPELIRANKFIFLFNSFFAVLYAGLASNAFAHDDITMTFILGALCVWTFSTLVRVQRRIEDLKEEDPDTE